MMVNFSKEFLFYRATDSKWKRLTGEIRCFALKDIV